MKKALIVGNSLYAPLLPNLRSSSYEIERWRDLLVETFGFPDTNVRLLADERATKNVVMDRLLWLFGDTQPGDQLVFIFCGHGVRIRRKESTGDRLDLQDEGLVLQPAGATDVRDVVLFDDDLTSLYCSMSVDGAALPTFIFDCCYSAGFDFSEQERERSALMLPSDGAKHDTSTGNVVRFGLQLTRGWICSHPVILAASGEYDLAIEVERHHAQRSLFSSLALAALRTNPALTYEALIQTISPCMRFAAQQPWLGGDADRMQRRFLE